MEGVVDQNQSKSVISAMFLVAGTCIGGGMLALPVATGISGFVPSMVMMALCWLAMTASALLLLEVNLWMREGSHVITMAKTILGPVGQVVSWIVFLFISYASLVGYSAIGGDLVVSGAEALFGASITKPVGCFLFVLFFGGALIVGSYFVGRVNAILFIAMIASYCALVALGINKAKLELLSHQRWSTALMGIPLLLTTFSFQTMLPSLTPMLKSNAKALRFAIIGGTSLTFVVYFLWQWMVLGIVPVSGPHSLLKALEVGEPVTQFLRVHVGTGAVSYLAEYFAFFALVTSFLGIGLGLKDFLADGLKIPTLGWGKLWIGLLIGIPVFFFSAYYERVFLIALDSTGGFGDTILNGMIPVLMVWIGRYYLKFPNEQSYRVPGGKPMLIIVMLFFAASFTLETLAHTGVTCSIFDACQSFLEENQKNGGL